MRILMMLSAAALGVALAQPPGGPGFGPGPRAGAQPQQPQFTELKAYLGLTDAQIQQIQGLQKQTADKVQSTAQQLRTTEQSLRDLLSKGTTDAAAVGKLVLAADSLRKQMQAARDALHTQVVGVLFADQKTKLAGLEAAIKLQPAIHQAQMLDLLTPPAPPAGGGPGPRGFRGPGPGPGGPGPGGMEPMRFRRPRS